jgi:hypothetical protein
MNNRPIDLSIKNSNEAVEAVNFAMRKEGEEE